MGALATVVPLDDVDPIELPNGSWSRMLVTDGQRRRQPRLARLLGLHARHDARAGVPRDRGVRLRRLGQRASCCSTTRRSRSRQGDALHIPGGVWHAVANTGDEDVVMVFGFPHPDYPPTERRG